METKNYANGVFITQRETKYDPLFSVGIHKENFIKWLQELEVNEKGYCNLTIMKKKDADKYGTHTCFEDRYMLDKNKESAPAPQEEDPNSVDLPF